MDFGGFISRIFRALHSFSYELGIQRCMHICSSIPCNNYAIYIYSLFYFMFLTVLSCLFHQVPSPLPPPMHVQCTKHTFYSTQYETMFLDQESMLIKMTWIRIRIENFEIVDSDLCPPIWRPSPKEVKIFGGNTGFRVLICN